MTWISRETEHNCTLPRLRPSQVGWVWECDDCQKRYRTSENWAGLYWDELTDE